MRSPLLLSLLLLSTCAPGAAPSFGRGRQALDGGPGPARWNLTATPVPDGTVLLIGGGDALTPARGSVDRWTPGAGTTPDVGSVTPRKGHSATLLLDGRVLVAGGEGTVGAVAEIGDGSGTTWSMTGPLLAGRAHHTATLLEDGRVLLVGGVDLSGPLASCEIFDPGTETFTPAASLSVARGFHAAVRIRNGQVLVIGGGGDPDTAGTPTAELWDPNTELWSGTGSMALGRTRLTATRLISGDVLVTGGVTPTNIPDAPTDTAEIYWVPGGAFSPVTSTMAVPRAGHTTTLLPDGSVLVAGGEDGSGGTSFIVERFVPATVPTAGTWSRNADALLFPRIAQAATLLPTGLLLLSGGRDATGGAVAFDERILPGGLGTGWVPTATTMPEARAEAGATLLPSGEVLLAGGRSTTGSLRSTLLFHPALGTFTPDATLLSPREAQEQLRLPDGRILISGGRNGTTTLQDAEIFDPSAGVWTSGGDILDPRVGHRMTLLPGGQVLITGGSNGNTVLATSARFDPTTGQWSGRPDLAALRADHSATLLDDGTVLLAGGLGNGNTTTATLERLDPASGRSVTLGVTLATARSRHRATRLPDGTVLITGGLDAGGSPLVSAERFDPLTDTFLSSAAMNVARADHVLRWLGDGRLLIAGGAATPSAEIYDPATGTFTATSPMNAVRTSPAAAVLLDGRVLLAGGSGPGPLASAELFEPSGILGPPAWTPTLDPPSDPVAGQPWTLSGTGLRGRFGGGSGHLSGARAELPFVHLQPNNGVDTLLPALGWSDTAVTVDLPSGFPTGPAQAWVTVHAASSTPRSVTVTAPSTPAADLRFFATPASASVGTVLTPAVQVEVVDGAGTRVVTASHTVTLTLNNDPVGGSTLGGTRVVQAVAGLATFSDLTLDQPGVGFNLLVTAPGLTKALSPSIEITATPAPAVDPDSPVSRDLASVEACEGMGLGATITVTPLDASGAPLPTGRQVVFTASRPEVTLGSILPGTDASGRPTYSALATTARCDPAPVVFMVRVDGAALSTKPEVTFTCPPLEATGFSFFANPATALADGAASASVTLSLHDRCDQPAFGRLLELHANPSGLPVSVAGGPRTTRDTPGQATDGTATFAVTSFVAGRAGITATAEGVEADSDPALLEFTLRPGLELLYTASHQRAVVGEVVTLELTLLNTIDQDLVDLELTPFLDGLKKLSVTGATDTGSGPLRLDRLQRGERRILTLEAQVRLVLPIVSTMRATYGISEGPQRRSVTSNAVEITTIPSSVGRGCECSSLQGPARFPHAWIAVYLLGGWALLRRRRPR